MRPVVHLPPAARRRRRTAEQQLPDATDELRRYMEGRMADMEVTRDQLHAQAKSLVRQWRRESREQRRDGHSRQAWLYLSAADALEGWADRVFSPTTVWPGL